MKGTWNYAVLLYFFYLFLYVSRETTSVIPIHLLYINIIYLSINVIHCIIILIKFNYIAYTPIL